MRDDALLALRFWRDAEPGAPWRARLTDLRGGAVATFHDVPSLLRYLSDAFGAEPEEVSRPPSLGGGDAGA